MTAPHPGGGGTERIGDVPVCPGGGPLTTAAARRSGAGIIPAPLRVPVEL